MKLICERISRVQISVAVPQIIRTLLGFATDGIFTSAVSCFESNIRVHTANIVKDDVHRAGAMERTEQSIRFE